MNKNIELQNCLLFNFSKLISVQSDDSNYVTWKFLIETLLKGCGLMRYIDGSFPCPPEHMTMEENGVK
ncbi:putative gag-polypeptide of LTR copia-type [Rosa chinensis]|uniref:Putative gag-polypeptide of LTR copia-type n=1 Tax=Rosa chinensis TaxID=74649 RepID=A0A2P6S6C2_ROSCH|nr:putative gag-polypeptide of LTR copia-type [Rosa chinensis]